MLWTAILAKYFFFGGGISDFNSRKAGIVHFVNINTNCDF
jgi:hypothetical protein